MATSVNTLETRGKFNVIEIKFFRRHDKPGFALTRRGLFTTSFPLLNSPIGKKIFNFDPPRFPPAYPYKAYNLACMFDCLVSLDWRMVPADSATIVQEFNVGTLKNQRLFWKLFADNFGGLTVEQRKAIANS